MKSHVMPLVTKRWCIQLICMFAFFMVSGMVASAEDFPANPLEKEGWVLDVHDEFNGTELNNDLWITKYLECRVEEARSHAKYKFRDGKLVLYIDETTPSYRPNERIWVSGIQTGAKDYIHLDDFHHHIEEDIKYAPKYGYFEVRSKSMYGGNSHNAFWAVGLREESWQNIEFDISEHFTANSNGTMMNIHKWADPNAYESGGTIDMGTDLTDSFHIYAMEWDESGVKYYFDNQLMKEYSYSPDYPIVFFLSVYYYRDPSGPTYREYEVDYFRAYKKKPTNIPDEPVLTTVDNEDSGYSENGANWKLSGLVGYNDGTSRYCDSVGNIGSSATWTPVLAAGEYDVYTWYPAHSTSASEASYKITHEGGVSEVIVDQTEQGGSWRLLGRYTFADGNNGKVVLEVTEQDISNRNIRTDAVKFQPVN